MGFFSNPLKLHKKIAKSAISTGIKGARNGLKPLGGGKGGGGGRAASMEDNGPERADQVMSRLGRGLPKSRRVVGALKPKPPGPIKSTNTPPQVRRPTRSGPLPPQSGNTGIVPPSMRDGPGQRTTPILGSGRLRRPVTPVNPRAPRGNGGPGRI